MFNWLRTAIYEILLVVRDNAVLFWRIQRVENSILDEVRLIQDEIQLIQEELTLQSKAIKLILELITPSHATQVVFSVDPEGQSKEVDHMIMKPQQQFTVSVAFKDEFGNMARVDGVPQWTNDNDSVLTMEVAADGMSAVISSPNGPGSGQISCSADADLGAGVNMITGFLPVEVVAGDAVLVELNPGEVTEINVTTTTTPAPTPPTPPTPPTRTAGTP